MSKPPNGPTVKMHLQNLHTMEELNFIGNCLKGSRPILSFDAGFEKQAHLRVIKELFTQIFGVPKNSRKTKPFVDHVMGFTVADGKIWVRVFPDKPITKKPQETRMGKGKGAPEEWVCVVRPGRILFEMEGVTIVEARRAMQLAAAGGALLLVLMWTVVLPPANNPFMDDHLIYAMLLVILAAAGAGTTLGLGSAWGRIPFVRRHGWLR